MNRCKSCNADMSNKKLRVDRKIFKIPFACKTCGSIMIKYEPTRDLVFLWRYPAPDRIGLIYLPIGEDYRGGGPIKRFSPALAIVLAMGSGYTDRKKGFVPTHTIEVGDVVLYNKNVPWTLKLKNSDQDPYTVTICGFEDIHAVVEEPKSESEYLI